jgi:hypothetical protein
MRSEELARFLTRDQGTEPAGPCALAEQNFVWKLMLTLPFDHTRHRAQFDSNVKCFFRGMGVSHVTYLQFALILPIRLTLADVPG